MSEELSMNKITAEVITDFAKTVGNKVINKVLKAYKDTVAKGDIDYGVAFEKYLTKAQKSISMSKTLLYGQTPHHLYSFYEPMGIQNQENEIDTVNVNNILDIGNKIIVTGTGGIGKSMLMRHCFLDAINNTELIPILVELRGLNEKQSEDISIEKYIYDILCIYGFELEEEYFKYSLDVGCYLILFDGYDEVKNNISQKVSNDIMDFSNKYSENHYIVSSRPLPEFVGWSNFVEYTAMPLTKEQALGLINKLNYDNEIKAKFVGELDNELFEKYYSFASNPLLLTIMLMTYEGRISIPDNKVDFYDQAFATLFHKHDATKKGGYKREIRSNLSYEDFRKVFAYFCFITFFRNEYEFTETRVLEHIQKSREKLFCNVNFKDTEYLDDLTKSVCMLVSEGLNYRFAHRSFQEYFAALYTTQLSDNDQKRFITSWLEENSGRITTDYLEILSDLQPERFMKNVLYDAMKELYEMYIENGQSDEWYIKFLYAGVTVDTFEDGELRIGVRFANSYYCTIIDSVLYTVQYSYNEYNIDGEYFETAKKIEEAMIEMKKGYIFFDELKKRELFDEVLEHISWVFDTREAVFNTLNNINLNTFGEKRKFESMLEDL